MSTYPHVSLGDAYDERQDARQQAPEYREHRGVSPEAQEPSVHQQLRRLGDLVDEAEKGMVGLLDARAGLESRIGPVLSQVEPINGTGMIGTRVATVGPRCGLAAEIDRQCLRLESLIQGMDVEQLQLRGLAQRVEV